MKKTTSLKLSKQLTKYGALTAAIAGVAEASGQSIIYTDFADLVGAAGDSFNIDIDGNSVDDFQVVNDSSNNLFLVPLVAGNEFIGSVSSSFAYPFAFNSGVMISSSPASSGGTSGVWNDNGFSYGVASLNYGSCSFGSKWCSVTDRYLGLRFDISGGTHYAWIRMDVDANGNAFTIKDSAYNDTAGAGLMTGQQTLGVEDASINDIRIVALNKNIGLYNLPAETAYRLFDMSGKLVLEGTSEETVHTIDARSTSNGVFILEVENSLNNAVIRKKLVL